MALETVFKVAFKEMLSTMHDTEEKFKPNQVGKFGGSLFYCINYLAPPHVDNDAGVTLATQLIKEVKDKMDYAFCYLLWGICLVTTAKTTW